MYPADKIHQLKNTVGIKWRSSNKQFIQDTPYRPKEKDENQEITAKRSTGGHYCLLGPAKVFAWKKCPLEEHYILRTQRLHVPGTMTKYLLRGGGSVCLQAVSVK